MIRLQLPVTDRTRLLPVHAIGAVGRYAVRVADQFLAAMKAIGFCPHKPPFLPCAFLLELGAVLELGAWERHGLLPQLAPDLPSFQEAMAELAARAKRGPAEFEGPDPAPLFCRMHETWLDNFAWDGPELLGCEALVGAVDEDDFAAVLAEFLLEHQHELSKLFPQIEETP